MSVNVHSTTSLSIEKNIQNNIVNVNIQQCYSSLWMVWGLTDAVEM